MISTLDGIVLNCSALLSLSFQVMINNGFTPDKDDYEFCTKVDNMIIPKEGFFGISAATGGLAGIFPFLKKKKKTLFKIFCFLGTSLEW